MDKELIDILLRKPSIAPDLLGNPYIPKSVKEEISKKTDIYIPTNSIYYKPPIVTPQLKVIPEAVINSFVVRRYYSDSSKDKAQISLYLSDYVLPEKAQEYLLQNYEWQAKLAANPSISTKTQKLLAQLNDELVSRNLAQNPSLAPSIAYKMLSNPKTSKLVKDLLLQRANLKKLFKNYISHSSAAVRAMVAVNPNLPLKMQWTLSSDLDILVRLRLAANPNISYDVAKSLALLDTDSILCTLAWNTSLWYRLFKR